MRHRYENFGGIIANDDPPFLAFVDRAYMREHGLPDSPLWNTDDADVGQLSAPTEVHLATTNACPCRCPHCYMGSGEQDGGEMDTATLKGAMQHLADMGVFHVALGGGEALARPDLFEIAQYCRQVGLVPNLTVSGALLTPELAAQMSVFGQVNLSLDGVGAMSGVFRGCDVFDTVDRSIDWLLEAGVATGLNCVVGRSNYDGIRELFRYAKGKHVNEVEFLRFKPSGRGRDLFDRERMTHEQNIGLLPLLQALSTEFTFPSKIDCSFVPMLCWHDPSPHVLEATATYGCEAGNVLMATRSNGRLAGCSFLPDTDTSVLELASTWNTAPAYGRLRRWRDDAPEPCRSCAYLQLCNGGCHAVALAVTGDVNAPDPDCPRVVAWRHRGDHGMKTTHPKERRTRCQD